MNSWYKIKAYFKRVWEVIVDIITDREFKKAILEADKSPEVIPFKFSTIPNDDAKNQVGTTRKKDS